MRSSTVSTRVWYGNVKFRPPFPQVRPPARTDVDRLDPGVRGAERARSCSVCRGPIDELHRAWIVQPVGRR